MSIKYPCKNCGRACNHHIPLNSYDVEHKEGVVCSQTCLYEAFSSLYTKWPTFGNINIGEC